MGGSREQVISGVADPHGEAVKWITDNGRRKWSLVSWVTCIAYPDKMAGLRGTIEAGENPIIFTIRDDWDPIKRYHVNAHRGAERRAYCGGDERNSDTEQEALQRYSTLTDNIKNHGDAVAAERFMR